VAIAAARRAN